MVIGRSWYRLEVSFWRFRHTEIWGIKPGIWLTGSFGNKYFEIRIIPLKPID